MTLPHATLAASILHAVPNIPGITTLLSLLVVILGSFCVFATASSYVSAASYLWRIYASTPICSLPPPQVLSLSPSRLMSLSISGSLSSLFHQEPQFLPPRSLLEHSGDNCGSEGCPLSPPRPHYVASTILMDKDALRQLIESRLNFHSQVKELEQSDAALRDRIWSLEEERAVLRMEVAQRTDKQDELLAINQALQAEKASLVLQHDSFALALEGLHRDLDVLEADMHDASAEKQAILVSRKPSPSYRILMKLQDEKEIVEEKLAEETAEVQRLTEERRTLEDHVLLKEGLVSDLMEKKAILEVRAFTIPNFYGSTSPCA